jgi:hypothetical protein
VPAGSDAPADQVLSARAVVVLHALAVRRDAPAGLADRVVAWLDARDAAKDPRLDPKGELLVLLTALDRGDALEARLATWTAAGAVDVHWREVLARLQAERGDLAAATATLEAASAAGPVSGAAWRSLAGWYLVRKEDARRDAALDRALETEGEWELQQRLWGAASRLGRRGDGVPEELDPETLRVLRAVLRKTSYPGNVVGLVTQLYRPTKDFRVLEALADGVVGHSPEAVYGFLQSVGGVVGDVHEEATLDTLAARVGTLLAAATRDTDRRALRLLLAAVEHRAAQVKTVDPAHGRRALEALRAAGEGSFADGERVLYAELLAGFDATSVPALDELALKLSKDPLALRIAHNEHPVRRYQFEHGRKQFRWDERRKQAEDQRRRGTRLRHGVGVAAAIWGDFGRPRAVVAGVSVGRDGSVELRNGLQDIGGGIRTPLAQVVAEELGLPVERIKVSLGDTRLPLGPGSGGSVTTASITPVARDAAFAAKQALLKELQQVLGLDKPPTLNPDGSLAGLKGGKPAPALSFKQAAARLRKEQVVGVAERQTDYGGFQSSARTRGTGFGQLGGVQFAEVEVDTLTGVVRVLRVVAAHDCGRPINPMLTRSQIYGGVIQGISYALFEDRRLDRKTGKVLNGNFEQYKIAGALDVPQIDVILLEELRGRSSTDAGGIGEPATVPTAAAVANAIYNAIGVRLRELPITPARVLAALQMAATPQPGRRPT